MAEPGGEFFPPSHRTVETLRALQSQFATDITEELAVDLLSHLHILQHTLLQQLQSARARRNAGGGYNGGRAVEAAMDPHECD